EAPLRFVRLSERVKIGLGSVGVFLVAVAIWQTFQWHQRREREEKAASAFRFVVLALWNCASAFNDCLPDSVIRDDDGRPRASWRLVVLGYLDAHMEIRYPHMPDRKKPWIWIDANQHELDLGELARQPNIYSFWEKSQPSGTRIAAV